MQTIPLYTDTRYNDKIRYNDNLTVIVSHKLCKNIVFNVLKKHEFGMFVRITSLRRF